LVDVSKVKKLCNLSSEWRARQVALCMAFDSRNRLYVADAGNQRIEEFEIPDP
jgi:hypothetical protein